MEAGQFIIIALGGLAGAFVSGLVGFGTGITAMGIWLYAVSPPVAAPLVVACSVIAQAQTMPTVWRFIEARRVVPFIAPGILGVPLGALLLSHLDPRTLKLGIGALLCLFSIYMLIRRTSAKSAWGGVLADGVIGFSGGVLGGMVGLSGPPVTIWATVRGWSKHESRSVFQVYNLSVLSIALLVHAFAGLLNREVGWALLAALPGTICGAWLGAHTYGRVDDERFRIMILLLLCISGGILIWGSR
jgi:uncharacterized membrane protein YfcA